MPQRRSSVIRTALAVLLLLAGCSPSRSTLLDGPSYDLPSISDPRPDDATGAYVLLKPEGNVVSLFNLDYAYDSVEIFRRDTAADSLRYLVTAGFPPPPDLRSIASVLQDTLGASLDSRYEFWPYRGDTALPRLPVSYTTSDSAYAARIEGMALRPSDS